MVGDKIKELRKKCKMTQLELANRLDISASAVGMYEQNRRDPNYGQILKIAELFSVTVDYLLGNEDDRLDSSIDYKTKSTDFNSIIENFRNELLGQKGLMFKGEILTDEDIVKVVDAMKIGVEVALKAKNDKGTL